jgi:predicted AAA+ superfamily ATPase
MVHRAFWLRAIEEAWRRRSVVWLMGVRRVGKTVLGQSIAGAEYFDLELPRVRALVDDPESFLRSVDGRTIVLDEIHRVPNPAELLKIAADHYPGVRILATGSSTLGASSRFRDTLAGRKAEVWLTPMVLADLADFGRADLQYRLLRGGLPPFWMSTPAPEREYQEWLDAFWAKDVLELFRLERRQGFQRLVELLMAQSGGIFEATRFARACEISRTTVANYVAVLEVTFVVHLVRPFAGGGRAEIVAAPKAYAFDTGFVSYYRGWDSLRSEDRGLLWEHLVLNELHAHLGRGPVRYWRTKGGLEVDFVIVRPGRPPVAVECKWSSKDFDPAGLRSFRAAYPEGESFLVATDVDRPSTRSLRGVEVSVVSLADLVRKLTKALA